MIDIKDLQEKIGYGHGTTFGYTDDGIVWMCADSKDAEGRPIQSVYSWPADKAHEISKAIGKAAIQAKKAGQLKLETEQSKDGRPDSNRTH